MRRTHFPAAVALVCAALVTACGSSDEERAAARADAIDVVERFGSELMRVDLRATGQEVTAAVRDTYGPYVTTLQLGTWLSDLRGVPGRSASSPFPARIEVRTAEPLGNDAFDIEGDIVYVASLDGDPVMTQPVRIRVVRGPDDVWRISEWNSQN